MALPMILEGIQVASTRLPMVPELQLYLIQEDLPQAPLSEQDYSRLMESPPYWAFCWGGGQALARWILDHPDYLSGCDVVDFGAGSGVVAIAAALVGASRVTAVDMDQDALRVSQMNARLNKVVIQTATTLPGCELPYQEASERWVCAADVCYEESGADMIRHCLRSGMQILIAESRQTDLLDRFPELTEIAQYSLRTFPDLDEATQYDSVRLYASSQMSC